MPKINILPLSLRNKIAAGEVVERPASVVKELIENSIDAGSTRIAVEIAHAGKRLIKVSDNGTGMEKDDVLLAFERYATSKIKDEDDLFRITTMGFRGEALSSIAAVAKVRLATAPREGQPGAGVCVEIAGGEVKELKNCPAEGTVIEVKDLFFNTPARRKFLKSDGTESYHIIDAVTREAMSHPRIGFILLVDGSEALNLPGALSHRERLMQIYGKEVVDGLVETELQAGQMSARAFLSKPSYMRNNRNTQFFFINNRPVKDQSVSSAVYRAYEELIPREKHPVFFLFLEMDPSTVDFNVHPAKREVRFERRSELFNFVYRLVRSGVNPRTLPGEGLQTDEELRTEVNGTAAAFTPQTAGNVYSPALQTVSEAVESLYAESVPFLYLGDTFVAIPEGDGITIMDYHAAHERVNYERFLKKVDIHSCRLLFPHQVKVQAGDYRIILENLRLLSEFGLDIEDFGHETVIVRGVPEVLRDADLNALLSEVASCLVRSREEGSGEGPSGGSGEIGPVNAGKKALAASLACHSSVRGREVPDGVRLARLLKELAAAENPHCCPHGRPTKITMPVAELRKMFRK